MKPYQKDIFGYIHDKTVYRYRFETDSGVSFSVMTYGATVISYDVFDKQGHVDDIIVGAKQFDEFIGNASKWGATIGPVAGRIKCGECILDDKQLTLEKNNGNHHLHGGSNGFDSQLFDVVAVDNNGLTLELNVSHGFGGYPGNRVIHAIFELLEQGQLNITYKATSDKKTLMNLTNHAYFNLSGHFNQSISDHHFQLNAVAVTELLPDCIPTGKLQTDVPFLKDLKKGVLLENIFNSVEPEITQFGGLDHGFSLEPLNSECVLYHDNSKRQLTIRSNQSGVVVYTANVLNNDTIDGNPLIQHGGIAIEMQVLPDAVHQPHFGSIVLNANETYQHHITWHCQVIE